MSFARFPILLYETRSGDRTRHDKRARPKCSSGEMASTVLGSERFPADSAQLPYQLNQFCDFTQKKRTAKTVLLSIQRKTYFW
jgi:hypothetical protein